MSMSDTGHDHGAQGSPHEKPQGGGRGGDIGGRGGDDWGGHGTDKAHPDERPTSNPNHTPDDGGRGGDIGGRKA